jgi:hypothetical protein
MRVKPRARRELAKPALFGGRRRAAGDARNNTLLPSRTVEMSFMS